MMYMTMLHWIIVSCFAILFLIFVLLASKEKNTKTAISMIFSSLLLVLFGIAISLFALDKYTKKGEIIKTTQRRNFTSESVVIKGMIKNIGNFPINYCKIAIKITNQSNRRYSNKNSYFTPTMKLENIFGSKKIKSNVLNDELLAVEKLNPKKIKSFQLTIKLPSRFENPKYRYKLFCH